MEDISHKDSGDTSQASSTDDNWKERAKALLNLHGLSATEDPFFRMYQKDKYARDRVMKSARLLLPYLKGGDMVLDVGCYTQEARKYYPYDVKYTGIDKEKFHKDTIKVNLDHGFEPISCKAALCLETLEHLIDPSDVLESIQKSLDPAGRLVVSLPNEATLFHRIRSLLGTVDAGCFQGEGKHLHLPSLRQARVFLSKHFQIEKELYYISPSACGSKQAWVGRMLTLLPDRFWQALADWKPSLFARGWIFLLKPLPNTELTSVENKA